MKLHFNTPEFDAQLLRAMGYAPSGAADIGECYTTAAHIKEGDFEGWYHEWRKTAERIHNEAVNSIEHGHLVSARLAFMRASNYYRTAMYFLYGSPVDPRLPDTFALHVETFEAAMKLFETPPRYFHIPFEGYTIPACLFRASMDDKPRPTLVINGGYDSTLQECYWAMAAAAVERGYHALCFDGPGQGQMLIQQGIHMRPDWEVVITCILNYLMNVPSVAKDRIALYGLSWGGYLAPRAACFEPRIAALIANPGQMDAMLAIKKAFPHVDEMLGSAETQPVEQFLVNVLSEKMMVAKFRSKMWIHGVDGPLKLLQEWTRYNISHIANQIQCPTFVLDSENEPYSNGQAKMLFDLLQCHKSYSLFTNAEGAGEHCEAGAITLLHARVFDWLDAIIR